MQPDVRSVDEVGILLTSAVDEVVDVLFDGRRVWSFWVLRDSVEQGRARFVEWPQRLRPFLDGETRLTVRTHVGEDVLYDEERRFGAGNGRIAVVDPQGRPLGFDKSGRLQQTFETRSSEHITPLLDAIEKVIAALKVAGVDAFPAYGTLLGAVRDGKLIGHDSDADLAYVSTRTDPVDVVRESFILQRRLVELGYRIRRYSGAGFKVLVTEADGTARGLDVFGGFFEDGNLVVLGEIRTPYDESWLRPLGTTVLEGRTLPAPRDTDRFLTATYGPSWRVPDPAFEFTTPASTHRRLNDWFRGTVTDRAAWDRKYQARVDEPPHGREPELAHILQDAEPAAAVFVDVGCGRGEAVHWLAQQGRRAIGLEWSPASYAYLQKEAERDGLPASYHLMNLLETRHVLGYGARFARLDGPRVVMARHMVDTLTARGRKNLYRFAKMVCGREGRLYLEFLAAGSPDDEWAERRMLTPIDPSVVADELVSAGARVLSTHDVPSRADDEDDPAAQRMRCRMLIDFLR